MACSARSIGFLLNRAARNFSHYIETLLAEEEHPISHEQFTLMMELYKEDNISQQELAKRAFRGKTSVTRLLNGLEAKGYISRCASEDDKRKRMVCLTFMGQKAEQTLGGISHKASVKALENIAEEEGEALRDALELIFQNTKETCELAAKKEAMQDS